MVIGIVFPGAVRLFDLRDASPGIHHVGGPVPVSVHHARDVSPRIIEELLRCAAAPHACPCPRQVVRKGYESPCRIPAAYQVPVPVIGVVHKHLPVRPGDLRDTPLCVIGIAASCTGIRQRLILLRAHQLLWQADPRAVSAPVIGVAHRGVLRPAACRSGFDPQII